MQDQYVIQTPSKVSLKLFNLNIQVSFIYIDKNHKSYIWQWLEMW